MTEEIIAYTIGSFWLCTGCGPSFDGADPVPSSVVSDCYVYRCDQCWTAFPTLPDKKDR